MPIIEIATEIKAPIEVCFDLARSVDFHVYSMKDTGEQAIAGVTSGLIGMNQKVTWRAKHFGIWQNLTSEITSFDRPYHFRDAMKRGAFKRLEHDHFFEFNSGYTVMRDRFDFQAPFGLLGKCADILFLQRYMLRLISNHNLVLKVTAETNPERFLSLEVDK